MIVIIPCGARKLDRQAQAQKLYTGSYHKMCQRYARKLTTPDKIYILSAKYGLLEMTDVIEPYNTTLGDPGAISVSKVYEQAKALDLLGEDCIVIGGRMYVGYCKAIWPSCATPLQDNVRGGNGKQLQWMKSQL